VELFDQLGIELQRVERDRIRYAKKVGERQQQEEISLAQILPMDSGSIGSHVNPFVDFVKLP